MDVQRITMDPGEAVRKFNAYRKQLSKRNDIEYVQATQAYAALAKGTPLINLAGAFQQCMYDEGGRPLLAIARADRTRVTLDMDRRTWNGGPWATFDTRADSRSSSETLVRRVSVPERADGSGLLNRGRALVPMVPADVRPNVALRDCFILWEVGEWTEEPDRDPLLLKHIAGDLYAVLAEWDLTEVERAIMGGRRQ